jgi:hypothetical protein
MAHGPDEPVPATALRFDVARAGDLVAERMPDRQDMTLQNLRLNMNARPDGIEEFVMCHHTTGMFNQIAENIESLWRQIDALVVIAGTAPPEAKIGPVDTKRRHVRYSQ